MTSIVAPGCYAYRTIGQSNKSDWLLGYFEAPPSEIEPSWVVWRLTLDRLPADTAVGGNEDTIRYIPSVILDKSKSLSEEVCEWVEIFVVHEMWFLQGTIIFREGMGNIYRISQSIGPNNAIVGVDPNQFPAFFCTSANPFSPAQERINWLHTVFLVRHNISAQFTSALKRNRGKSSKLRFSLNMVPTVAAWLLNTGLFKYKCEVKGQSRSFPVLRSTVVSSIKMCKQAVSYTVNHPAELNCLLGGFINLILFYYLFFVELSYITVCIRPSFILFQVNDIGIFRS